MAHAALDMPKDEMKHVDAVSSMAPGSEVAGIRFKMSLGVR